MNRYIIVNVTHHTELEAAVNKMIDVGYLPVGNPYISPDTKLAQAMLLQQPVYTQHQRTKSKEK